MHKANGYVVVAATPVLFPAQVETVIIPKSLYQVTVTFGNKKVFFDPKDGKSAMSRTIEGGVVRLTKQKGHKRPGRRNFRLSPSSESFGEKIGS